MVASFSSQDGQVPIFDPDALTALIEMFGDDDMGAVIDLLDTFLAESQKQVDSIRSSLTVSDMETLYRMAHSLKASSVIFGAKRLSDACAQLEKAIRDGCREEECAKLMSMIIEEQQQVTHLLLAVRQEWTHTPKR